MRGPCASTARRCGWCCRSTRSPRSRPWTVSQPVLPTMPGVRRSAAHMTTSANGLTTLFAAFDVATGVVNNTSLHRRHRAAEFKKFPIKIENEVPEHLQVHLICDNYGNLQDLRSSRHGSPNTRCGFHLHSTPHRFPPGSTRRSGGFGFLADQKIPPRRTQKRAFAGGRHPARGSSGGTESSTPFTWDQDGRRDLDSLARFLPADLRRRDTEHCSRSSLSDPGLRRVAGV